jgi:hypothetical protein
MIKTCDCENTPCKNPETDSTIRRLREEFGFCPSCGELKKETLEARKVSNELCPVCGTHLQNWRETFGEEHYCYPGTVNARNTTCPNFSHVQQVLDDEAKVTMPELPEDF